MQSQEHTEVMSSSGSGAFCGKKTCLWSSLIIYFSLFSHHICQNHHNLTWFLLSAMIFHHLFSSFSHHIFQDRHDLTWFLLSAMISPMMISPSSFTVSLAASAASISSLERDEFRSIHPWRDRIMWWVLPAKRLLYIFHNFTNSGEVDPLLELVK